MSAYACPTDVGAAFGRLRALRSYGRSHLTRKRRNPRIGGGLWDTATGIRTRVSAMRGRRPSPLDDSGAQTTGRGYQSARSRCEMLARRARRDLGIASGPPWGCAIFAARSLADVAELVDAHGSGPCLGDQVEVRVLSSASSPGGCSERRLPAKSRVIVHDGGRAIRPSSAATPTGRRCVQPPSSATSADLRTKTAAGVPGGRSLGGVVRAVAQRPVLRRWRR
jgi:hypothetical protein